ncbi:MAG: pyridoxamine 5'-phosphate oxidase family protein, partial [Sporichthyaceae bacterium]|nr:pyridoxamine 5'-phosphate oxidase family protein [Sporichthyaceae bacterium]
PAVTPVTFALVEDCVVFRTAEGSRLAGAVKGTVVAFQVDEIDAESRSGWSAIAIGRATEVRDDTELRRLATLVQRWVAGARDYVIRINADIVTGRQLV